MNIKPPSWLRSSLLSLALLLTIGAGCAQAALALVQHKTNTATAAQNTVAVTVTALTAGNLVVVGVGGSSSESASSIADGGNTYTQVASAKATEAGGRWSDLWYAKNISGGSVTVTTTYSAANANRKTVEIWEVSGADTTAPLDGNGVATTGAGPPDTGPAKTTTNANDFLAAIVRTSNSVTTENDATFTLNDAMGGGGAASSAIVSATGTYTPIWNEGAASSFAASVAAFKQAAAGGGGCTDSHMLGVWRCDEAIR